MRYHRTFGPPQQAWTWAGLRPIRTIGFDKPPAGRAKLDCFKRRASGALALFSSDSLEHGLNISETPRSCALQRAPVRWTLTSEPTIGRSLRPCQSRKIMEQRIQRLQSRELFCDVTRQHPHITCFHTRAPEEARTNPRGLRGQKTRATHLKKTKPTSNLLINKASTIN